MRAYWLTGTLFFSIEKRKLSISVLESFYNPTLAQGKLVFSTCSFVMWTSEMVLSQTEKSELLFVLQLRQLRFISNNAQVYSFPHFLICRGFLTRLCSWQRTWISFLRNILFPLLGLLSFRDKSIRCCCPRQCVWAASNGPWHDQVLVL